MSEEHSEIFAPMVSPTVLVLAVQKFYQGRHTFNAMESMDNRFEKICCRHFLVLLLSMLALTGCTTTTTETVELQLTDDVSLDDNAPEALIATDLVSVLMQLPGFSPWATTLSLSAPNNLFGSNILNVLRLSGYGIQRVSADQGTKYVSYSKSKIVSNANATTNYSISIGRLTVSREYDIVEDQIYPTSLISIIGAEPKDITLNESMYRQRGGNHIIPSGVVFKSPDGRTLDVKQSNIVVKNAAKKNLDEQFSQQRFLVLARSRLFLESKLTSVVDVRKWVPVRQVLLVFPSSDSSFLGSQNKSAIKKLLQFYDADSTGFGITGCKRHKSLLWDGTEGDALDRQLRVRNELLVAGVDIARVRENGCFANEYDSKLTKNSVLITMRERP